MPRAGATTAPSAGGPRVMSDPGETPTRPQYGEYATPEEQRARIQQPDTTWLLETGQDPDALHGAPAPAAPSTIAPSADARRSGAGSPIASRRSRCSSTDS